jgi:hypothetical protein
MSRFRLFLILLLCLAIPAQGMAGMLATVAACPMAQAAAQHQEFFFPQSFLPTAPPSGLWRPLTLL